MGSFNKIGFISGLPILSGDEIVLIFMKSSLYRDERLGGVVYSTDLFSPALLPIFGEYDDYGRIENVKNTSAVTYIESLFNNKPIIDIVQEIDDAACRSGKRDEYKDYNFGLEHKRVFDFLANNKRNAYTEDEVPSYWLKKMGFTYESKNNDARYNQTWTHDSLPKEYKIHSDGNWAHLVKDGIQDSTYPTYHPSQLEEAMHKITNGKYESLLSDEDKNLCSLDISLEVTKSIIKAEEKKKSLGEIFAIKDAYETINLWTRSMFLTAKNGVLQSSEYADLTEIINAVDSTLITDFIRFNRGVALINAKYYPSNYGSQDQDFKLHFKLNKLYRNILVDGINRWKEDEDIAVEIKSDDREESIDLIINK